MFQALRISSFLIALMLLTTEVGATVLALHSGANDPETEGWVKERTWNLVSSFPVINDLGTGIDAWAVHDTSNAGTTEGLYVRQLTPTEIASTETNSWRLSTRLRVAAIDEDQPSPNDTILVSYSAPSFGFHFVFGQETDGSPLVGLITGGNLQMHLVDLDDLDNGYHLYEILFDPTDGKADFFVDGSLRFSDYEGSPAGGIGIVQFGSSNGGFDGQGNYNLVQLEVVPEPSTWVMMGIGVAALFTVSFRRQLRQ